jgi:hypothetical protein
VHPVEAVVAEIAVVAGVVRVHEVASEGHGLVIGCTDLTISRDSWRPLVELLVLLEYVSAASLDEIEPQVTGAAALADLSPDCRKIVDVLALVFAALDAGDAERGEHDA